MSPRTRGAVLAVLLLAGAAAAAPADTAAQQPPASAPGHGHAAPPAATAESDDLFVGAVLDRRELIDAVLARNPGLEAARLAWRAAAERVPQAGSLDDPMLAYGIAPLSIGSNDVHFGQSLEARQRLPYPGKLRLRAEAARADAAAAELGIEAVRLELAAAASMLYDDYYLVHRALEINAEHRRLLDGYMRVVTARYAAGEAPQQAPIRAEVELAHLAHEAVVLATEGEIVAARINALVHRPPAAPLPPPVDRLAPVVPTAIDSEGAAAAARAARPELARLDAEREARETAVELRALDRYPDFEAMGTYSSMWRETEHRWMLGVAVNLPLWRDRIDAGIAEAEAEVARVEAERVRLADELGAEARIARLRVDEAAHVLALYESRLLPAAADQVRAAVSGFQTGQVSFLDLIEAERNQRSVELAYEQTLADLYRRAAALDRALGRMPGGWTTVEPAPSAPSSEEMTDEP